MRGCGVTNVEKVNPLNLKKTLSVLNKFKDITGVRVIIAEQPCTLFAARVLKKRPLTYAYVESQHEEVEKCLKELACPAFYKKRWEDLY